MPSDSLPSFRPPPLVGTTLREHVLQGMSAAVGATGEFTSLLNHVSLAIRIINSRVRSAGLAGLLGYTGETNVQGEEVQKLDAFSNEVLINVLERSGHCGVMASEELDEAMIADHHGKYVVLFDPLDGSSNIDTNVGIGTIFAILRRSEPKLARPSLGDALRPGREIAAAGYVLYGPSTVFVMSTGHGAHGFTLDPSIGEFFLSHPDIKTPDRGTSFSVNEGNYARWSPEIQAWSRWIKAADASGPGTDGGEPFKTPYGARYVGSLVADAHRTLMKGGIFAYPADSKSKSGKLRLLYEANPMAYLFEQAGGAATDGKDRILDIVPSSLHQRVPLVLGSKDDVAAYRQFVTGERKG
ncbi:MAG: Fructose,6-bisphosphatase, type [Labilithrix sp.]|nr:Fructose,6-bisphosphatase, type [Labilithrix sp.]